MADACRVCLCSDRRMNALSNTVFQQVWEKLTDAKFNTDDGKPLLVCYICDAQLRKSHQLMRRAQKAEELLTAVINNGSEISQKAILLVASQVHDFDYKYGIGEVFWLEYKPFERNTMEGIKNEIEEGSGDKYEGKNDINIKEEAEDSNLEENADFPDVEPEISSDDDVPLKKIQKTEVQLVLTNTGIGAPTRKGKLNKTTQKAKRIKHETIEDIKPNTALISTPNNNCKTNVNVTKKISMDSNMKITKNEISRNISVANDFIIQTNNGSNVCYNTAENEIFVEFIPSADAVVPSTSLNECNEENDFSCHSCQHKCRTESELNRHLCKHAEEKPYTCNLCAYTCTKKGSLTSHINYKHVKEKNFPCPMCPYKFVNKGDLNKHVRTHTGEKPYTCDLCPYRCAKSSSLTSHVKFKHTKENNFSCHICPYKCINKGDLKKHVSKHTGEKVYICDLCPYRSSMRNSLSSHIKFKHLNEKNFSCHICQYKCVTKTSLNVHIRKHTGKKPYICDLCDLKFSQKVEMKKHIKYNHAGEKNFSCPICQYKSVKKYKLKQHIRVHTGEKPYVCDLCGHRFALKTSLNMHIKNRHTKEKNFSCHICQYRCVTNFKLNLHLRKHTGEKPYKCDFCEHRCAQKSNLVIHIKNKHAKENIVTYLANVSQNAP